MSERSGNYYQLRLDNRKIILLDNTAVHLPTTVCLPYLLSTGLLQVYSHRWCTLEKFQSSICRASASCYLEKERKKESFGKITSPNSWNVTNYFCRLVGQSASLSGTYKSPRWFGLNYSRSFWFGLRFAPYLIVSNIRGRQMLAICASWYVYFTYFSSEVQAYYGQWTECVKSVLISLIKASTTG